MTVNKLFSKNILSISGFHLFFLAMANYPRELFESEKIAKEQIPLLFGDLKTVSASSVGSDKVEAAPTRSNRTEVTHSTNVSDQSQVFFF